MNNMSIYKVVVLFLNKYKRTGTPKMKVMGNP